MMSWTYRVLRRDDESRNAVLAAEERFHRETVKRARKTFGMWRNRAPDELLRESRWGLRDQDLRGA
jgi:hypothetical protein